MMEQSYFIRIHKHFQIVVFGAELDHTHHANQPHPDTLVDAYSM